MYVCMCVSDEMHYTKHIHLSPHLILYTKYKSCVYTRDPAAIYLSPNIHFNFTDMYALPAALTALALPAIALAVVAV